MAILMATASLCNFQHAMTSALDEEAWQAYRDLSSCPKSAWTLLWHLQEQEQILGGNKDDPATTAAQAGAIVYCQGSKANDNNHDDLLEEIQEMWEQQTLYLLKKLNNGMPVLADSSTTFQLQCHDGSFVIQILVLVGSAHFQQLSVSLTLPPSTSAMAAAKAAAATSFAAANAAASSAAASAENEKRSKEHSFPFLGIDQQ
ncbi:hypothetical protein ACA910_019232 [Epithemia clementina (nom. ined.)]